MKPQVSVITPVYNAEKYLKQCLHSILNQSFRDIELICVDDYSTDNSIGILESFKQIDSRIKIIQNKKNLGAGRSRNEGIAAASGRFLQFTDADDLLPNGAIESLYFSAINHNVEVVRGSLALFQDDNPDNIIKRISVPD